MRGKILPRREARPSANRSMPTGVSPAQASLKCASASSWPSVSSSKHMCSEPKRSNHLSTFGEVSMLLYSVMKRFIAVATVDVDHVPL